MAGQQVVGCLVLLAIGLQLAAAASDDGIIKLPSVMETCGKKQCPGCPSDTPLDDYRLFYYAKTGVISYIKNTKSVLSECGSQNWDLYSRPTINFKRACVQIVAGKGYYFTVRVTFPCFGNPTKTKQGPLVYPKYGQWRVTNLYMQIFVSIPGDVVVAQVSRY
ncbi:hypothetical protein N2152v2_003247 [Parachlorella kessleri]